MIDSGSVKMSHSIFTMLQVVPMIAGIGPLDRNQIYPKLN